MGKMITSKIVNRINEEVSRDEMPNLDLVKFRKNEDTVGVIRALFTSYESVEGIKIKDVALKEFDSIYEFREKPKSSGRNDKEYYSVDIESSRYLNLEIVLELTCQVTGEVEDFKINMLYPELIDDQYFLINNNRYTPIFQIVDAEFYNTKNTIVYKNLFMPLSIKGDKKKELEDINGELSKTLRGRIFYLLILSKKNVTTLQYIAATLGFKEMFKYLDIEKEMKVIDAKDDQKEDKYYFSLNKHVHLEVDKKWLDEDIRYRNSLVLTIQELFKRVKADYTKIMDDEFWVRQLGSKFTKNGVAAAQINRAESVMVSYRRILDTYSKKITRLPEEDKEDTNAIVRYMMRHYESICRMDKYDAANKRIRVTECLLYPLAKRITDGTQRGINTPKSRLTLKELKSLFSSYTSNEFLIVKIIQNNNLMRFSNAVNTIELFSTILKSSKSGHQTAVRSNSPTVTTKSIHPSYLGVLDLVSTSSNEPGMSNTIIPTAKIYDPTNAGAAYLAESFKIPDYTGIGSSYIDEDDDEIDDEDLLEEDEILENL